MVVIDATHQLYSLINSCECIDNRRKFINRVKNFISMGASVNVHAPGGRTILMSVCKHGIHELMTHVIKCGAKMDLQDSWKRTALMTACICADSTQSIKCIDVLLDAGCNVDIRDIQGQTALMHLAKNMKLNQFCHDTFMNLVMLSDTSIINDRCLTAYNIFVSRNDLRLKRNDNSMCESDDKIDYDVILCHSLWGDKNILTHYELNLLMGKMRTGYNIKSATHIQK